MARTPCRYTVGEKQKVSVKAHGRRVSRHALRTGLLKENARVELSTTLGGERVSIESTAGAAATLAERSRRPEALSEIPLSSGATARAADTYRLTLAAGGDDVTAAAAVELGDALASAGVDPVRAWEASVAAGLVAAGVDGAEATPAFADAQRAVELLEERAKSLRAAYTARVEALMQERNRLEGAAHEFFNRKVHSFSVLTPQEEALKEELDSTTSRLSWDLYRVEAELEKEYARGTTANASRIDDLHREARNLRLDLEDKTRQSNDLRRKRLRSFERARIEAFSNDSDRDHYVKLTGRAADVAATLDAEMYAFGRKLDAVLAATERVEWARESLAVRQAVLAARRSRRPRLRNRLIRGRR